MWMFIIFGFECICLSEEEKIDYLITIAELSHLRTNCCYSHNVSDKIITYFHTLGLVEKISKNKIFLSENFNVLFEDKTNAENKFLIIETNHKVYAYTKSKYELSILSLFCTVNYILDFLVVGELSEENVMKAFEKGITADQIVEYLEFYSRSFPISIQDLIRIWDNSRKRCIVEECYLYSNFINLADFKKVLAFCEQNGFLLNFEENKRMIMIKLESHATVKEFVKRNI